MAIPTLRLITNDTYSLLYSFTFNRLWAISISNSDNIEENSTTFTLYYKPSCQYVIFLSWHTLLPQDTVAPSVTLLHNSTVYTGPKLDKLKANYKTWLQNSDLFLTLAGFISYATGIVPKPSATEPHALSNWLANDTLAAALISSTIEISEWEYTDGSKGAKNCWDTLWACHHSDPPSTAAAGGPQHPMHKDHSTTCHCWKDLFCNWSCTWHGWHIQGLIKVHCPPQLPWQQICPPLFHHNPWHFCCYQLEALHVNSITHLPRWRAKPSGLWQ